MKLVVRMRNIILTILFCLPIILLSHTYKNSYWFEKLELDKSIEDEIIYSTCQDSIGYLWFGTKTGLYKYDGQNVVHYEHARDTSSLKDNRIFKIYTDREGEIWVLTLLSLEKYEPATDQFNAILQDENNINYKCTQCCIKIFFFILCQS